MKKKSSAPPKSTLGMLTHDGGGAGGPQRPEVVVTTPNGTLSRDSVPPLMRTNSNKRILNQRPLNLPTKTLRMKSLLWVKPTVKQDDLSQSVTSQVNKQQKSYRKLPLYAFVIEK